MLPLLVGGVSAQVLHADRVAEADLRLRIDILASDAFKGRKPGTAGETKTLQYLSGRLAAAGLVGGAPSGGWYQEVPLVHRRSDAHRALWTAVGGSSRAIGAFLSGPYHKPEDDLSRPIELGGTAEDTELTVEVVRKLADPARYGSGGR